MSHGAFEECPGEVLFTLQCASESPIILLNDYSDSGSGWSLRFCISNEL